MTFERIMRPSRSPEENGYPGFRPGREVVDGMVLDRDVEVTLRDGVRIYADVYRPENQDGPLPALIAFSPYGKHSGGNADLFPARAGLRPGIVSQYAKFEGPDPLFWCAQGYAVVNPDTRGSWNSEGDIMSFGVEEGRDYYDLSGLPHRSGATPRSALLVCRIWRSLSGSPPPSVLRT